MRARKAWAYITRREDLLVFAHPEHPEAGVQVPGGTLLEGEDPAAGVLRESREETGFPGLAIVRALGVRRGAWSGEEAEMHAFHLVFTEPVPERWEHGELSHEEPIRLAFRWMPVVDAASVLWPEQAAFVAEVLAPPQPSAP